MPAKPRKPGKYDENGLPRDPRDWTEDDWRDLWEAMKTVTEKVSERHADPR